MTEDKPNIFLELLVPNPHLDTRGRVLNLIFVLFTLPTLVLTFLGLAALWLRFQIRRAIHGQVELSIQSRFIYVLVHAQGLAAVFFLCMAAFDEWSIAGVVTGSQLVALIVRWALTRERIHTG